MEKIAFKRGKVKYNFANSILNLGVIIVLEIILIYVLFIECLPASNGSLIVWGIGNFLLILFFAAIVVIQDYSYRLNIKLIDLPAVEFENGTISIYVDKSRRKTFNLNEIVNVEVIFEHVWSKEKPHLRLSNVGKVSFAHNKKTYTTGYFVIPENINDLLHMSRQPIVNVEE